MRSEGQPMAMVPGACKKSSSEYVLIMIMVRQFFTDHGFFLMRLRRQECHDGTLVAPNGVWVFSPRAIHVAPVIDGVEVIWQ